MKPIARRLLPVLLLFCLALQSTAMVHAQGSIPYTVGPLNPDVGLGLPTSKADGKLDSTLMGISALLTSGLDATSMADNPQYGAFINQGTIGIDALPTGDVETLLADLQALGLQGTTFGGYVVGGSLPLNAIPQLANLASLRFASAPLRISDAGVTATQGDIALNADDVRSAFGIDGTGVSVGVISDSFDCDATAPTDYAADIASGDLPAGITVVQEATPCVGIDEGRAMLQLIHDIAPGATLLFHAVGSSQTQFAAAFQALEAAGADIIVDDISFLDEPFFQDGPTTQAIDDIVANNGDIVLSSAGNQGDNAYRDAFNPSGTVTIGGDTYAPHDFASGDIFQRVTIPPSGSISVAFQWDDPHAIAGGAGATTDLDIFLLDEPPTVVIADSRNANVGGNPSELLTFTNPSTTSAFEGNILVGLFNPAVLPAPNTIMLAYFNTVPSEYVGASSTFGNQVSQFGFAVGQAFWNDTPEFGTNPPLIQPSSALGGTPILFDTAGNRLAMPEIREQPRFTASTGGNTTFFGIDIGGSGEPDSFPNFFGTSASAPEAAAVVALMLQADPTLTAAQVLGILQGTAIDMDAPGYDFQTGSGFIQADSALASLVCTNYDAALAGSGYVLGTEDANLIDDLRKAILCAEADADADTIRIPSNATLDFMDADVGGNAVQTISNPLTIGTTSSGMATLSRNASASSDFRFLTVGAGNPGVSLTNLSIEDFVAPAGEDGGALLNGGVLTLDAVSLSGNTATNGGGLADFNVANVTNSWISNNNANAGGGIYTQGTLRVNNTAITENNNSSGVFGGGVFSFGTTTIANSTISANGNTNSDGGGLNVQSGTTTVFNSLLTGNIAEIGGGAVVISSGPVTLNLINSTIAANRAEGGLSFAGGVAAFAC